MKIYFETIVHSKLDHVVDSFDLELFKTLSPPLTKMRIIQFDGCLKGDEVKFTMSFLGIEQYWHSLILDDFKSANEVYFIDVGKELPWPFKAWHHKHIMRQEKENQTVIIDEIEYECNSELLTLVFKPLLIGYFYYRKIIYKKVFNV